MNDADLRDQAVAERVGSPCKKCGSTRPPDTRCSYCGGYGLVQGYDGDPMDCPRCGCGGVEWPPRCPDCSCFRSMKGWE